MGGMLRSELMTFCDVYLQPDMVFEIMTQLGEMGCVQFIDMTPGLEPAARKYISEVCRCAEMERKVFYMMNEMKKENIPIITNMDNEAKPLQLKDMATLETVLSKWESQVRDISENQSTLLKNFLELTEIHYVLNNIGAMMGNANNVIAEKISYKRSAWREFGFTGHLYVIAGVVNRNTSYSFEVVLWRISHGNMYYRLAATDVILKDPQSDREIRKVGFLVICQGEELYARLEKVCRGFRANIYTCPEDYGERIDMIRQLRTRIHDLKQVMKRTSFHRCKTLRTIAKECDIWRMQIIKSKAVYHNMNMFTLDITRECLIGQCWVPDADLERVSKTLGVISDKAGTNMPSFISKSETLNLTPPTFHRTNKFTEGFQTLISVFSDSKYREINPGLFTIITFPFLFAVMFGDVCHGLIIVIFAGWMLLREKRYMKEKSDNEIWNIMFGGRYVIFLMGVFSIFTGFFYNSYFSKPIMLTAPYWKNHYDKWTIQNNHMLTLDPAEETNPTYIPGVDPMWSLAKNEILFMNSIKMKMSIIIGVVHMSFGLLLSLLNHIYFKHYYAIVLEFIPRMIFLCFLFFWLVILMFMKWFMYSPKSDDMKRSPTCAPLILILFIDMLLMSTTKPVAEGCDAYMFPSQQLVQQILLFISLLTVPIMLFGTPIYVLRLYKRKRLQALAKLSQFRRYQFRNVDKRTEEKLMAEASKYAVTFGTLMITESIHTIEFVLSTISHTASYLRLWALSLAHEQLSHMLWHMIFSKLALKDTSLLGAFKIFVIFTVWAMFSVSVLVLMEGLSAFLHTLRLHWVEFMSKFFSGTGWPFTPFSFEDILSDQGMSEQPKNICKKQKIHYD